MKIESLYKKLERIVELEAKKESAKPSGEELTEYHQLISNIPIISPLELVEYHRFFDKERDTQLQKTIEEAVQETREEVQEIKDDLTQKQKVYVENAIMGLKSEYESRLKAKILAQLSSRCSDDTYSLIQSIIEEIK